MYPRHHFTEASKRLSLHQGEVQFVQLDQSGRLPFDDSTFDHVHASGVLHHLDNPMSALLELRRVLKPGGTLNMMTYNYNSIWLHLYVAYKRTILQGLYPKASLADRFRTSTDGEGCPASNCYTKHSWVNICQSAGFNCYFTGASASLFELSILHSRFDALMDKRLPSEHRLFLSNLTFDQHGHPLHNGDVAGIDACYHASKS